MLKNLIISFFVKFGVFLAIDIPWILFIVSPLYEANISNQMRDEMSFFPALLFYVAIIVALQFFTYGVSRSRARLNAFVLGLITYATYTLTNMAVIADWSWEMVITDIIWGGILLLAVYEISNLIWNPTPTAKEIKVSE